MSSFIHTNFKIPIRSFKLVLFLLVMVIGAEARAGRAEAATLYMPDQCANLQACFSVMQGGDTLIIRDGIYVGQLLKNPPSGNNGIDGINGTGDDVYTTVQAENTGSVIIDGSENSAYQRPLEINNRSYIKIEGIKVRTSPDSTDIVPVFVTASNHIKLIRVAAYNAPAYQNAHQFNIGPSNSDILLEECWAWGTGRYKFHIYQSENVIVRRCVARHDYQDTTQAAPFNIYEANNVALQNCIAIDSGLEDNSNGRVYGGLWAENNGAVETNADIAGSIFLNIRGDAGIKDPKIYGSRNITDTVIWDSRGGYQADDYGVIEPQYINLNRLTIGAISGTYQPSSFRSFGVGIQAEAGLDLATAKNSIMYGCNSYGVADYFASDYNFLYGNTVNYGGSLATPSQGVHDTINTDPLINGLLYLPRIESGSTLKTAGSDGGQVGAQIMNRIGVSETLYGEEGYDSVTADPLWPFPNESLIKTDFASYDGPGPSGTRGFASLGTGLYGGSITLTSYIWEYLGNPCPANICNYSGDSVAPNHPTGLIIQ